MIESNVRDVEIAESKEDSEKVAKESDLNGKHNATNLSSFDVWAMGVTTVIGGQYFSWNVGFTAGFGSFAIASFLIGFAYISLVFCICEITGALPFSGGSYGLARCTQGNYFGFLLGCLEAIEYIFYVASSFNFLGVMITLIAPQTIGYEPLIWLIFYFFSLTIYVFGGKPFWHFNTFLAILSMLILFIFCFGSLHYVDFNIYAITINSNLSNKNNGWFVGGMHEFMKVLPLASWFFVGVESLKMMCDEMPKDVASIQVPKGQISCVFTLFITMILILFITPSLPPGINNLVMNLVPFNSGFQLMFGLTDAETIKYATILSVPSTFATAFGFILMYGKIISSMAHSKLLPFFLSYKCSKSGSPYAALLFGSLLSYLCSLIVFYYSKFGLYLFNICILSAFLAYICQIIGYINMKKRFSLVKRTFESPLGLYGAYYSLSIWILGILSIIAFQDDADFALIAIIIIIVLLSLWYYIIAKKQQSFSEEERSIFFTLHVINHNLSSKKRRSLSQHKSMVARTSNVLVAAVASLNSSKSNPSNGGAINSNSNSNRGISQNSSVGKSSQKSQKVQNQSCSSDTHINNNINTNIKDTNNNSNLHTKTDMGLGLMGVMIINKKSKIRVGIQPPVDDSLLSSHQADTSPSTIDRENNNNNSCSSSNNNNCSSSSSNNNNINN